MCGCSGSRNHPRQRQQATPRQAPRRQPREGGPGQAGYYWNGPKRPAKSAPAKPE